MTTREVILDGGSPWGFRMHGGADLQQRLRISRVNPGSKASFKGIREGDFITSIDGQSTKNLTNSEAHTLLKSAGDQLKLGLNEEFNDSYKQKKYKTVIQETYSETIKNCHIMSSTETYLTTNKLKETNEEEKNNHSNGVNSEGFTSSSSTSVDSPNSLDLRGKNLGNLINEKDIMDNLKILQEKNGYRVESPPPVLNLEIVKKSPDKTPIITEIDDDNTCLECNTDTVVVNDLDIIWETTEELNPIKEELGHLTTISNKEENLRQFLESLQFDEISKFSIEGIKSITNLDVINEEEGDITEVEQESSKVSTENKLPTKNIKAFKNDCTKISPDLQIIKHKGKEEVFEQNLNNKCNNNEEQEINCNKNNKISLLDMIKYQSNDLSENTKFFDKESNLQSNEIKLNENCSSTILLKEDVTYNNLNGEICSLKISSSEELTKKDLINKIDDHVKFLSQENCVKPNTLRELCIKYLASFPFGIDILEELAQVSKQLENLTTHLPKKYINNHQNSVPNYFNIFKNQISKLNKNNLCNTKNVNKIIEQKNPKYFLPNMYIVKQMQYLIDCEKEIQEELEILENEKRRLLQQEYSLLHLSNSNKILNPKEIQNEEMYNEYMNKLSAHKYRQAKNIIKITTNNNNYNNNSSQINDLESEFIKKARKRLEKQGLNLDGMNTKILSKQENLDETNVSKQVLENFVVIPQKVKGVWSPGQKRHFDRDELHREISQDSSQDKSDETIPPVWTPRSAGSSPTSERKEFRPVNFESPTLGRKERTKSDGSSSNQDVPWKRKSENFDEKTLTSSHSAPGPGLLDFSRLPRAQNPTITLLQKAREGQIPKPTSCVESSLRSNGPTAFSNTAPNTRPESFSDSDGERSKIITHIVSSKKIDGIGPTTKDGMPLHLRSEIRDANMSQWYKNMYDTIHKQKPTRYDDEEYVTVRYKQRRAGKYPYTTGYLSEPEVATYDSDAALNDNKYSTLDRRRPVTTKQITRTSSTLPRTDTTIISYTPETLRSSDSNKTPPGKIENYKPGQSSISDNDAKKWWDEVMEIFDGPLEQHRRSPQTKGYLSQALKESGYESDSTLVFRRKDETTQQLSPQEQREVYKIIQKGGEVPLHGLRKLAPERPKEPESPPTLPHVEKSQSDPEQESPRKYIENEVTIHYKAPIRQEIKESLSEDELARRQADAMRKIYEEERRRKYLQVSHSDDELHDIKSRRHTDNFIPSQKSPIPLNRYDNFPNEYESKIVSRPKSPEPRLVARALYNFVGQTSRELTFKKGDMIYIRRQVDKNWYEGEINAMVGLFPANYVEIVPYDGVKSTPRKPNEGQARAKYNFIAQTHLELSLARGELVVVTRRVDDNWFEGRIGGRKGIFPVSYVEVLVDPSESTPSNNPTKPTASPASHSLLLNGSAGGKESMGTHSYVPSFPSPDLGVSYRAKPIQMSGNGTYGSLKKNPVDKALHIETQSEPIPYRALYKYRPQNEDELELLEGDTVYVLEKCDDGWYVGSSERTGSFGTFPGNYVERI